MVGHTDGQGSTRAALTNDGGDDGHFQLRHLKNIAPNGLALATFFSIDARIGTGCVDKGEDGDFEFLRGLHQTQGFAVALRAAHAKVARCAFFGVAAFLVSQHHAGVAIKARQATHNAQVIGKVAVAMQLHKVREDFVDVVQRVGALGVAGNLGDLPGREVAVDVFDELLAFFAELVNFGGDIDCRLVLHVAQFFDFSFKLRHRCFEV